MKEYYRCVIKIFHIKRDDLNGYVVCRNEKEEKEVKEKADRAGLSSLVVLNEETLLMNAKLYLDDY